MEQKNENEVLTKNPDENITCDEIEQSENPDLQNNSNELLKIIYALPQTNKLWKRPFLIKYQFTEF